LFAYRGEAGNIGIRDYISALPKSKKIVHQGVGVLEHSKAQYCLPSFIIPRKHGPPENIFEDIFSKSYLVLNYEV
jgi:hypothetical protein